MTSEALDTIGPYLDAYRVDVKGFSDETYKKLAGITHWRGILDNAKRAKDKWSMHVEIVTNIVPGIKRRRHATGRHCRLDKTGTRRVHPLACHQVLSEL
jgi:pyruvate-formate lyase-activating enzyme